MNLAVTSSDSEAAEADDEQEGDNSEEFSFHDDDIVELPSSEKDVYEVEGKAMGDESKDVEQASTKEDQLPGNIALEDPIKETQQQNFEIPGEFDEALHTDNVPSVSDTKPIEIVHDSLLDQGDVEVVLDDIYRDVVVDDPLLPQFEVEDSARTESEEEMIMIVQGSIESKQRLSTQPDTEEVVQDLVNDEDESSSIRLCLSSTDDEAFPGSSKENDDVEVPKSSSEVGEKIAQLPQEMEEHGEVVVQSDLATPSHGEGIMIGPQQIMESTTTEQTVDETESNLPCHVKRDDENNESRESITDEKISSNPDPVQVFDIQESDNPQQNMKEEQKDNVEICDDPAKPKEENRTENPTIESETRVQDPDIEGPSVQEDKSQQLTAVVTEVIPELRTLQDAHPDALDKSSNLVTDNHKNREHDRDDQIVICEAERVKSAEMTSNEPSVSVDIPQDSDCKQECVEQGIGFNFIHFVAALYEEKFISESAIPSTTSSDAPAVDKVKSEPTFVLSPPATKTRKRRKKRVDSSTQCK